MDDLTVRGGNALVTVQVHSSFSAGNQWQESLKTVGKMASGNTLRLSIRTPGFAWGEIHRNKPLSSFGKINGNWDTISCRTKEACFF